MKMEDENTKVVITMTYLEAERVLCDLLEFQSIDGGLTPAGKKLKELLNEYTNT